jgi:L-rhamnose mutarotase
MTRVAWTARLRVDKIEEYERAHAEVWPDVLALIKRAGVRNYSIYRHEERVFGCYECDDPEHAEAMISAGQRELGWAAAMAELFMPEVSERGVDELTEIFRLD